MNINKNKIYNYRLSNINPKNKSNKKEPQKPTGSEHWTGSQFLFH